MYCSGRTIVYFTVVIPRGGCGKVNIIAGCVCGYKLRVIFTMIAESENTIQ